MTQAHNSNPAPTTKPKRVVRRDPLKAAQDLERRFKDSMKILS